MLNTRWTLKDDLGNYAMSLTMCTLWVFHLQDSHVHLWPQLGSWRCCLVSLLLNRLCSRDHWWQGKIHPWGDRFPTSLTQTFLLKSSSTNHPLNISPKPHPIISNNSLIWDPAVLLCSSRSSGPETKNRKWRLILLIFSFLLVFLWVSGQSRQSWHSA